jgi:TPR repeat protein
MEILHRLADENNANAQNILGVCYFTGTNVAIDEQKAVEYLIKASEQDHTAAQRNLAITLENQNSPDKNKIISLYEKSAAKDDAYALNNLAVCYLLGDGVKQNVKQAVKYFEKAVKLGDDYAMVNLADCYALGNGVLKNDKKAFELYKQSAEKNNVEGIRNMADCLINGIGTKQDFQLAIEMYKKASDFGDIKAAEKYNELSEKLTPQKHSETTISNDVISNKEEKKSTLEQALNLGKKAQENKENVNEEKTQENKEITPPEKKKESISL